MTGDKKRLRPFVLFKVHDKDLKNEENEQEEIHDTLFIRESVHACKNDV